MDDKKIPEESMGQAQKEETQKAEDEKTKNPFGPHIKPALYIIYNEEKGTFGIIGAPGFLDDPPRAYYALRVAEKNLDEFYFKRKTMRDRLTEGVKNFQGRMNFRRFIRGNH